MVAGLVLVLAQGHSALGELPPLGEGQIAATYSYWTGYTSEALWLTKQGRFYCSFTDDVIAPGHENPLHLSGRWWVKDNLVRVKYADRGKSHGLPTAYVPFRVPDGFFLVPEQDLAAFAQWVAEQRDAARQHKPVTINSSFLSDVAPGSPLSPVLAPERFLKLLQCRGLRR